MAGSVNNRTGMGTGTSTFGQSSLLVGDGGVGAETGDGWLTGLGTETGDGWLTGLGTETGDGWLTGLGTEAVDDWLTGDAVDTGLGTDWTPAVVVKTCWLVVAIIVVVAAAPASPD